MDLELFRHYVLALMMVDLKFLAMSASVLKPSYFENAVEQTIARFMLEHLRETKATPDRMALIQRASRYFKTLTKGGGKAPGVEFSDVAELVDTLEGLQEAAAAQYQYVKIEFTKFCRDQALKDAIIASVMDLEKKDYSKIKSRVVSALAVGSNIENRGIFLFQDSAERKSVDEIRRPISTGFKFIDGPSKGGLGRGEFGLIQAPPNTGKTTTLVNIGAGIAKMGNKVAHISCEMQDELIVNMYERCWLHKSDKELTEFDQEGRSLIAKFFHRMKRTLKSDVNVKDFPANRLSIEELYGYLLMLESVHGFKPDAVVLDYMDILAKPLHISKEVHEQQDWQAMELRAMAKELDFALWTATQGNRGAMDKQTTGLGDVAGGFMKNAHADITITLNQTIQEQQDDILRAFWAKNRFGPKYLTFNLITDFEKARLEPA